MRRTLSIILSAIMLLSACVFAIPASAAEGTAINTADEFLNMAAEGTYYLNSDITLSGTYVNAFKGTFDGNGHTVTVSSPMFADFSGVVKNLTINGAVNYMDADAAAFAVLSSYGIQAENVTNNAKVTVMGNGQYAAGFVCIDKATQNDKSSEGSSFTNCVNNGEIYIDSTVAKNPTAAGLVARADSITFTGCTNNAKVTSKGNIAVAAGICARISPVAGNNNAIAYNCVNKGDITSVEAYADAAGKLSTGASETAGLFANIGVKSNVGTYIVYGCVNNGNITGTYRTSGFVGYCYGSGTNQYLDLQFCINTGNITYGRTASSDSNVYDWCGPFIGYTNTKETVVKYNIDIGSYTKDPASINKNPGMSFFGCSTADVMVCDIQHNYLINKESFSYYTYASSDDNAAQRHVIDECDGVLPVTLEDLKSGKIAYIINEAAKADDYGYAEGYAFYQNLGSDDLPTVDSTHGWVTLSGSNYVNGDPNATEPEATTAAPEVEETTAAPEEGDVTTAPEGEGETTTAPEAQQTEAQPGDTEPAKSGCGGFVAGSVAIVAILGTALIIKKRD
ncbi:MAG: hypothetical protein J6S71_00445 [Clostridia bacterium]|nr:hypothetical protein [Clostridia bacterium]